MLCRIRNRAKRGFGGPAFAPARGTVTSGFEPPWSMSPVGGSLRYVKREQRAEGVTSHLLPEEPEGEPSPGAEHAGDGAEAAPISLHHDRPGAAPPRETPGENTTELDREPEGLELIALLRSSWHAEPGAVRAGPPAWA